MGELRLQIWVGGASAPWTEDVSVAKMTNIYLGFLGKQSTKHGLFYLSILFCNQ